ncbi:MAG TPA: pyridine nucleotide-disulfide oxidoreductase [Acidiferrobacteraceae bacterium]|nr:pyridine nucleotide-disulfide oxidoreductase [Acidiferrobacteraceae bacterium]
MTDHPTPIFGETLFHSLQQAPGLGHLDAQFLDFLRASDQALHQQLIDYRGGAPLSALDNSALLLAVAAPLEKFIAQVFGIETQCKELRESTLADNRILAFKKQYVQRRARRYRGELNTPVNVLDPWLSEQLQQNGIDATDRERAIAEYGLKLLDDPGTHADAIDKLVQWCVLCRKEAHGKALVKGWTSFKLPELVDYQALVTLEPAPGQMKGRLQCKPKTLRRRDGFSLTDSRMSAREVQGEINYCIYCHDHEGDFCSKGFPEKKGEPERGLKTNPLGVTLTGCPLEEKISEMHSLKRDGLGVAALAMSMVDNPMLPATGHRICNDCMKGCIYQKQDPVDIPQIETRVLTDVLALPWGVEIYHLLTRWNPLRQTQYVMKPYNGRKVLISGQGPAGFTLAHYLTMEGCAVVGIDGLKIEPLPERLLIQPIRDYAELEESLDTRILTGFGGVAEYGITVRWDKNFLRLIYLTLARRPLFQIFGGVRLGGTLTLEDASELGFDHVCIANGAGLPRVIPMKNSLARGMRQANDFLMALQLTGAAKSSSLANLQVRMPAVVIGGGLTAIDTATEVQAYYIKQVEKTLYRFEQLCHAHGEDHIFSKLDEENRGILNELLEHGRAVKAERLRASDLNEDPDFIPLLRQWGGVTLTYRRELNESPAYLRNHEEVIQAMREGIYYVEGVDPLGAELDEYDHVLSLVLDKRVKQDGQWRASGDTISLPARSIFVAAGAFPNTIYEREYPGTFRTKENHFTPHINLHGSPTEVAVAKHCKSENFGPFTSYQKNNHWVSFIGDTHPVFHGSVVKAIASAQRTYPAIMEQIQTGTGDIQEYRGFRDRISDQLTPRVTAIRTDHPAIVEIHIRAPRVARNFKAGQFFRLQTYESLSPMVDGTRLQIPLQTVSGAGIDGDTVRLMLLRMGPNHRLAERLQVGDPLVLMGPTGASLDLGQGKNVLVITGKWGAAVMLHLGPALRAAGNRVLMINAFAHKDEVYYQDELEAGSDQILWATASDRLIDTHRDQDISVQNANIIELLKQYGEGDIKAKDDREAITLKDINEIYIMGSTGLLKGLQSALKKELKGYFQNDIHVTGTVGSPMQCMLKGVCGQCLQWQIDPHSGKRTQAVFSCAQQDQPLFTIDLDNLVARQSQNRLAEILTSLWLDHILKKNKLN